MKSLFMKDSLENSSLTEMLIEDTTQQRQNDWEKNYQKEVILIQGFWKILRDDISKLLILLCILSLKTDYQSC